MKIRFPSVEFDDAVAAVCHGTCSEGQAQGLNELLLSDRAARDEYILRIELHSRLGSDAELFSMWQTDGSPGTAGFPKIIPIQQNRSGRGRITTGWAIAAAACFVLAAAGLLSLSLFGPAAQKTTSKAVAMLNLVADARWSPAEKAPRLNAPLEPGVLRLESGLAQIAFYSGARIAMEGPAELRIISQNEAACQGGKIKADIPPQARGFRVQTPQATLTDAGATFGLEVTDRQTELHVFKGSVSIEALSKTAKKLPEGNGTVITGSDSGRSIKANPAAFASLFNLQEKSVAAAALRYQRWREASAELNADPTLLAHFDFVGLVPGSWQLRNKADKGANLDGTIVGCRRGEGRWPDKSSLEFQSVNDRVRLSIPGEFESLTLAAWVSVNGLDRQINSLFMSDGFEHGTVHWLARHDGVLGITVIGRGPGNYQIVISPPVLTLDLLGTWVHLAVVVDGRGNRVAHYVNGAAVSEKDLIISPPFRIGDAELGNWNAKGFPEDDPFMIRNFSGSMDEFCVFGRALDAGEIRALHSAGRPQGELTRSELN